MNECGYVPIKLYLKNSGREQDLAVVHSLTAPNLMYDVRYEKGHQWQSLCTDDGESPDLSGPLFHCSYTGAIFYKIFAAGNNKVRLDGQLQIEGEGCISSPDHALIAYYRLWIAIM